ncbi:hypothetical protein MN116_007396 [Schistosoma mekongi]|uniref:PSP proline-rich domain-containing protein n=1 Tax=Schistosoma mekongi TaxID=38744 RepID=A0AAE1Z9C0_SCHME|nr:hypothetical protein MN116_007396 [Schistosoma mekongi]
MANTQDDIFVIDKCGSSLDEIHSNITYDFTELRETSPATTSQSFKSRKPVYGKRYHEFDFDNKFRPGRISRELRRALNLSSHDIPIHIYRMRTLGYPPGWLKKAVVGGNLMMFDSVNVDTLSSNCKVSYNKSALIGYPGFNIELDRSVRDEYLYLKCPPMQKHHMLDNFYASLTSETSCNPTNTIVSHSSCSKKETVETVITLSDCESGETSSNSSLAESLNKTEEPNCTPNVLAIHEPVQGTPTPVCPLVTRNDSSNEITDHSPSLPPKRPSLEAFSMGIQPFRPFENLPGVHGGYQRVLNSLKNSREYLISLSSSSDSKNSQDSDSHSSSDQLNRHNGSHSYHKRSRY